MIQFPPQVAPPRVIGKWQLRRLFNEGRYIQIIRADSFRPVTLRCKPLPDDSPYIGKETPRGSISHTLAFRDNNDDTVFVIVRYITPEGKIGAGKKNDPTTMTLNGVIVRRAAPMETPEILSSSDINKLLGKQGLPALLTYVKSFWHATGPFRFRLQDKLRELRNLPRYSK